mgnify:CR=1 FL=1
MTDNGGGIQQGCGPGGCSVGETIAVLAQSVDLMSEELTRVRADLRGNGRPGIITSLALMERRLDQLEVFEAQVLLAKKWVVVGSLGLIGNLGWAMVTRLLDA